MIELYDEREINLKRRANKIWSVVVCVFGAACLAACITLCCLVNVRNVQQIQYIVMAIAVVGGWLVIYILVSVIAENRHEITHAENMLGGEREEFSGKVSLEKVKIKISGSITVVKAVVTDGNDSCRLNVNLKKADRLKNLEGEVKLYVVHGYVVAIEVEDENN